MTVGHQSSPAFIWPGSWRNTCIAAHGTPSSSAAARGDIDGSSRVTA